MLVLMFVIWTVMLGQIVAWPRIASSRVWCWGAVAGTVALSLAHQLMFSTLAEDAFISFRYSQNLAEGHGLVFNIGERVEGYSNFLWVVVVAIPHALFNANIVVTARVLGVLSTLATVVIAYVFAKRITGSRAGGVLAATITAASSSFAAYGPSGLETPLFGLLALGAVLAVHANRMLVAGLLVALATMTRPDGVVLAAIVGVWLLARAIRRRAGWLSLTSYVAGAAALVVPWTIWRLSYYGYLMPNAIAAKAGSSLRWQLELGWNYLVGFADATQALLVFVPIAIFVLASTRTRVEARARATIWLLFTIALASMAFFIATGGDWMPAWRFFAPAMPLLAVALSATWTLAFTEAGTHQITDSIATQDIAPEPATARAKPDRLGPVLASGIGLLLLLESIYGPRMKDSIDEWHTQVDELATIGTWLRETMPDGTIISTFANGALSYEAGPKLPVVDQLGLTDEHIARHGQRIAAGGIIGHSAHDYPYVVNVRRPDLIFVTGSGFARAMPCTVPESLGADYVAAPFKVDAAQLWAPVFIRKDRAPTLLPKLDAHPRFESTPCPSDQTDLQAAQPVR